MSKKRNGHPFEPCPDTPNCHIESLRINQNGNELIEITEKIIDKMGAEQIHPNIEKGMMHAVFRIPIFGFKDDVNIAVEHDSTGHSTLYIKSASRVGYSDLGVNRRRVNRILKRLKQKL